MLNQTARLGSRVFTRSQRASFSTKGLEVVHDAKCEEFQVNLDTHKAFLKYRKPKNGVLEFEHTEVPEVFQGKGVGKLLVTEALKYVVDNNLKVKIHCGYALKVAKGDLEKYGKVLIS